VSTWHGLSHFGTTFQVLGGGSERQMESERDGKVFAPMRATRAVRGFKLRQLGVTNMWFKTLLIPFSLAGLLALSMTVSAQDADFSDNQLDQFVSAQDEVMEIRDEYVGRIESTDDRDEAMELEQEANEMMVEAVEDTGLTVDTYSAIAQAASQDSELAERIQAMMN